MQPGYVISKFKQVNSLRKLQYSMFFELRNKIIFVLAVICLENIRFCFRLVDCLKVKCDAVFLKIYKECKTNVMWSSIVVVFPSEEFRNNKS